MKQYLRGDLIFSKLPVIGQEQLTLANFWNFTSKNLNIFISLSESITEAGNVDENLRHNHSNEIFSAVFSNGTINIKIPKVWPLKWNLLYIEALFNTLMIRSDHTKQTSLAVFVLDCYLKIVQKLPSVQLWLLLSKKSSNPLSFVRGQRGSNGEVGIMDFIYNGFEAIKLCSFHVHKNALLEKSKGKNSQRQTQNRQCASDIADER